MNEVKKQTCAHCKTDPGPDPRNNNLWFGFLDKETGELVCYKCRKKHYGIKSNYGTKDFAMVEFPVMLITVTEEAIKQKV